MEQRPHVPGYGKDEKMHKSFDREMTLEELEAMEVPDIEVIKKGVVQSKVEALRKPDERGAKHARDMILQQIDAEMMKPVKTDIERRVRDLKIERLKQKINGAGQAGNA